VSFKMTSTLIDSISAAFLLGVTSSRYFFRIAPSVFLLASRRSMNPEVSASRSRPRAHFSASSQYMNARLCGKTFTPDLDPPLQVPLAGYCCHSVSVFPNFPNKYHVHSRRRQCVVFNLRSGRRGPRLESSTPTRKVSTARVSIVQPQQEHLQGTVLLSPTRH
jgi:hypothetical protein